MMLEMPGSIAVIDDHEERPRSEQLAPEVVPSPTRKCRPVRGVVAEKREGMLPRPHEEGYEWQSPQAVNGTVDSNPARNEGPVKDQVSNPPTRLQL